MQGMLTEDVITVQRWLDSIETGSSVFAWETEACLEVRVARETQIYQRLQRLELSRVP